MGWITRKWSAWRRTPGVSASKRSESKQETAAESDVTSFAKPDVGLGPDGRPFDAILLAAVVALVGFGLVMVYSASSIAAAKHFDRIDHDTMYLFWKQLRHIGIGLGLMIVGMVVDYRWYKRLAYPILGGAILLLIGVLLFGTELNHARRWLVIAGVSFQPSEVMKISLLIYMAYSVEKKDLKVKQFSVGFIPHLALLGLIGLLLMKQPDFGSTLICATIVFSMLFVAGARVHYILMFLVVGAGLAALAITSSPYRMNRWQAFVDPTFDPYGINYQITQSVTAIGSGGLTGKGLGLGHAKLGYVPELWNDFIGAAIGEEFGLIGLVLVIALFGVLVWRGIKIAFSAREYFGMYLAYGFTLLFGLQAAINLGVVTGFLPNKGLTLPFISYGGTSMFISLFVVGVLLNISMAREDSWEAGRAERERKAELARLERKRRKYLKQKEA